MTITRTTKLLVALAAGLMAVLLMVPAAGAQPYPGGAVLTLSTTSGGPGSQVTATIQGCSPGTTVDFTFESTPIPLGTATVGPDGTASLTFTVPNVAPGTHYVVASCVAPDGSIITLRDPFTVTGGTSGGTGTLPRTGSDNTMLIQAGAGLLAVGALLLLITRKRSNRVNA